MASTADLAIIIKAVDQSSGPLRAVSQALHGLGQAAALPGKALGGVVDGLGKVGLAGMGLKTLADGARGLGDAMGVGLLSEMEQVRASINAFTKDGGQTEAILKQIREEANKTPFSFKEMATATAALMPVAKQAKVGLMDLVKEAEILAASNPMEGLEGASFSLREAMTGDFTSIIERFNLSRQTINKLKDQGVPALEIVRRAMKEMGFDSDLIAAKADTLEGRWSTFMDTLDTLKMQIGQPIFDALKEGLVALQGWFDANTESLTAFANAAATNIGRVITIGKALFAAFTTDAGAMGIVMQQLREMFGDDIANAIEPFINGFMRALWVVQEFQKTGGDIDAVVAKIQELFGIDVGPFVQVIQNLGNDLGVAFALFQEGDISGGIQQIFVALSELTGVDLTGFGTALAGAWDYVVNVMIPTGRDLATMLEGQLRTALDWMGTTGWPALQRAVADAGAALENTIKFFQENVAVTAILVGLLTGAATAWALHTAAIIAHNVATAAAAAVQTGIAAVTQGWAAAQALLNAVMAANPIGLVVVALAALAAALIYAYNNSEEFRTAVDGAMEVAKQAIEAMWRVVKPIWDGFVNAIMEAKRIFDESGGDFGKTAQRIGQAIVDGIGNAIAGGIEWISSKAKELADAALGAAKRALGIQSPSKEFQALGREIAAGLGLGIDQNSFKAVDSLRKLSDELMKLVRDQLGLAPPAVDAFSRALGDLERQGNYTADAVARIGDAARGLSMVIGEVSKQQEALNELQERLRIDRLFNAAPQEAEFRKQYNQIRKEEAEIRKAMLPALREEEAAQRNLAAARAQLDAAKRTKGERDDKIAQKAVEAAEKELARAKEAVAPYEEQLRLLKEKEEALRLEEQLWRAQREESEAALQAQIEQQQRTVELFKAQQKEAEKQVKTVGQVEQAVTDAADATDEAAIRARVYEQIWKDTEAQAEAVNDTIDNLPEEVKVDVDLNVPDEVHVDVVGDWAGVDGVPEMAKGGIVRRPTLAMIGEGGEAEAVIPLSKLRGLGGGGPNVTVYVQGSVISEGDLVRKVRDGLVGVMRRNGSVGIA